VIPHLSSRGRSIAGNISRDVCSYKMNRYTEKQMSVSSLLVDVPRVRFDVESQCLTTNDFSLTVQKLYNSAIRQISTTM